MKIKIVSMPTNSNRSASKWKHDDGGPLENIVNLVNSKDVNFVKRLKDSKRKYIKDWASNAIATHKLGVSTDENGNHYIYPEVQEINGELVDFTRPPYNSYAGMISAEERGDTVRVKSIEDGLLFTENYKNYYPKGKTFANGGPLFNEFSNGVTLINEGGTHEENPNEGVPMGLDYEGIPNLVEEGEVIFNGYVFSNRLIVPDEVRTKYKLRDTKDLSFADAARDIQKMSEEMPNDPIVKRTMETRLNDLINEQEMVRAKKNKKNKGNRYDWGSYLQYAPVALSSALATRDALSGYDIDYSLFEPQKQAINNANVRIDTKPVTTNIEYKPFDTRTPLNELAASKAATTRAIMNTSGANPAVARTLLTSADYNYNNQLSKLWRSIEEAEYNRRLGFEQFRTGLEADNRARKLQADSTTAEILRSQAGLWGNYIGNLYNAERAQEATYSTNLSNVIADLTNLVKQQDYSKWIAKLQEAGIITNDEGKMALKLGANGGKIKRRRRLS